MDNNFVNRKDRIIASAIEIISEAGLMSLTTKSLAMKENMSESLLYRYFGGVDEVLVEVAYAFTKFDNGMIATVEAKNISHLDKVLEWLRTLSLYYENYKEMSSLVLNYEELLHNVHTREIIAECIAKRSGFLKREFKAAIAAHEIVNTFTPEELCNMFMGSLYRDLLNRRIHYDSVTHEQVVLNMLEKMANMIRIKPKE